MKSLSIGLITVSLLFAFAPAQMNAATEPTPIHTEPIEKIQSERAELLIARLNDIKEMDKSGLNFSEKRKLRKEARSIKAELKDIGGGVYISAGALLVAILLIVLLL